MIKVARQDKDDDRDWDDFARDEIAKGNAVQTFVMSWKGLKDDLKKEVPGCDVWYTERNGDPIVCLVPEGTPPTELPDSAMNYIAFEWIDPDKDFGSGFFPKDNRKIVA